MSDQTIAWVLLGVNILFFGGNVVTAEWILSRKRRELREANKAGAAEAALIRETAEALHTVLRFRHGVLEAIARLERLREISRFTSGSEHDHVTGEIRGVARQLLELLNRPS